MKSFVSGTWLAQWVEPAKLDLGVMRSSSTLGMERTQVNKIIFFIKSFVLIMISLRCVDIHVEKPETGT